MRTRAAQSGIGRLTCALLAMVGGLAIAREQPEQPAARLEQLTPLKVIQLQAAVDHVQGIEVEGDRLWVTSVNSQAKKGHLHLFHLPSGKLIKQVEIQDGERFHPGGIALDGASLWIPVAEYRRDGRTTLQRRDKRTLGRMGGFPVDDHIGCVAAGGGRLAGGNWDSRQIYYWNRQGKLLDKKENPTGNRYQDMKIVRGTLIASGVLSGEEGAVDWLDLNTLALRRRITAGRTDRGVRYTNEGMAVRGGKLYLLPEDGPSRLFVFPLPR